MPRQRHRAVILPLYIVGTPLGNLNDFSPRAVETLLRCDFIAAEDTRVTKKLLSRFDIRKPLFSYHEHNRSVSGPELISRMSAGECGALVTDAGMPSVSDPGAELVAACAVHGVEVFVVPGPCAVSAAVALSGFSTGRFCFEGFLSTSGKSRRGHLGSLTEERRTLVFYEAPHKLLRTLRDMKNAWGDRRISISREMTKIYEQTLHGSFTSMIDHFENTPPKGEFTLVIEGAADQTAPDEELKTRSAELAEHYRQGGMSASAAARAASAETGVPKREIYALTVKSDVK
jgi:16S rRNA (cytidine1402-2'-O)-methyltransferase